MNNLPNFDDLSFDIYMTSDCSFVVEDIEYKICSSATCLYVVEAFNNNDLSTIFKLDLENLLKTSYIVLLKLNKRTNQMMALTNTHLFVLNICLSSSNKPMLKTQCIIKVDPKSLVEWIRYKGTWCISIICNEKMKLTNLQGNVLINWVFERPNHIKIQTINSEDEIILFRKKGRIIKIFNPNNVFKRTSYIINRFQILEVKKIERRLFVSLSDNSLRIYSRNDNWSLINVIEISQGLASFIVIEKRLVAKIMNIAIRNLKSIIVEKEYLESYEHILIALKRKLSNLLNYKIMDYVLTLTKSNIFIYEIDLRKPFWRVKEVHNQKHESILCPIDWIENNCFASISFQKNIHSNEDLYCQFVSKYEALKIHINILEVIAENQYFINVTKISHINLTDIELVTKRIPAFEKDTETHEGFYSIYIICMYKNKDLVIYEYKKDEVPSFFMKCMFKNVDFFRMYKNKLTLVIKNKMTSLVTTSLICLDKKYVKDLYTEQKDSLKDKQITHVFTINKKIGICYKKDNELGFVTFNLDNEISISTNKNEKKVITLGNLSKVETEKSLKNLIPSHLIKPFLLEENADLRFSKKCGKHLVIILEFKTEKSLKLKIKIYSEKENISIYENIIKEPLDLVELEEIVIFDAYIENYSIILLSSKGIYLLMFNNKHKTTIKYKISKDAKIIDLNNNVLFISNYNKIERISFQPGTNEELPEDNYLDFINSTDISFCKKIISYISRITDVYDFNNMEKVEIPLLVCNDQIDIQHCEELIPKIQKIFFSGISLQLSKNITSLLTEIVRLLFLNHEKRNLEDEIDENALKFICVYRLKSKTKNMANIESYAYNNTETDQLCFNSRHYN